MIHKGSPEVQKSVTVGRICEKGRHRFEPGMKCSNDHKNVALLVQTFEHDHILITSFTTKVDIDLHMKNNLTRLLHKTNMLNKTAIFTQVILNTMSCFRDIIYLA